MKFLVAILTSSDCKNCRITYESIITQKYLDFDIYIIVNSLNKDYINEIKNEFRDNKLVIIETESNGKPGKGHNSVLNIFKQYESYDYCILIDSADIFYYDAFCNISKYIQYKPDILLICYHDYITHEPHSSIIPHIGIYNFYLNFNINEITTKIWYEEKGINPFNNNINNLNTVARPILFSRKALNFDLYYDENMNLFDDYIVFMKAFEHTLLHNINGFLLIDSDIYLYNRIHDNSVTYKYTQENKSDDEDNNFKLSIYEKYLLIKEWNLTLFPKLTLGQFNEDDIIVKKKIHIEKIFNLQHKNNLKNNMDLLLKYSIQENNKILQKQTESIIKYQNKN